MYGFRPSDIRSTRGSSTRHGTKADYMRRARAYAEALGIADTMTNLGYARLCCMLAYEDNPKAFNEEMIGATLNEMDKLDGFFQYDRAAASFLSGEKKGININDKSIESFEKLVIDTYRQRYNEMQQILNGEREPLVLDYVPAENDTGRIVFVRPRTDQATLDAVRNEIAEWMKDAKAPDEFTYSYSRPE